MASPPAPRAIAPSGLMSSQPIFRRRKNRRRRKIDCLDISGAIAGSSVGNVIAEMTGLVG
jgi:hypothetical protein